MATPREIHALQLGNLKAYRDQKQEAQSKEDGFFRIWRNCIEEGAYYLDDDWIAIVYVTSEGMKVSFHKAQNVDDEPIENIGGILI